MMLIFPKKMRTSGGGGLKIPTHADKRGGGKKGQNLSEIPFLNRIRLSIGEDWDKL